MKFIVRSGNSFPLAFAQFESTDGLAVMFLVALFIDIVFSYIRAPFLGHCFSFGWSPDWIKPEVLSGYGERVGDIWKEFDFQSELVRFFRIKLLKRFLLA